MFVQSSGIGNMINALLSLTAFYELPLALFVSRQGRLQGKDRGPVPHGPEAARQSLQERGSAYSEINTQDEIAKVERELPEVYSEEPHPCVPDEPGCGKVPSADAGCGMQSADTECGTREG